MINKGYAKFAAMGRKLKGLSNDDEDFIDEELEKSDDESFSFEDETDYARDDSIKAENINFIGEEGGENMEKELEQERRLTTGNDKTPAVSFLGIEGMDISASWLNLPWVKLVQKSSSKTVLKDGKDAAPGTFYFTDLEEAVDELSFIVLRAKIVEQEWRQDEELRKSTQLRVLCVSNDFVKLFILVLPVTSFSNWGKLLARMKEKGVKSAWEYEILVVSQKKENQKGQFYVADFTLGAKLDEKDQKALAKKYAEYGEVLNVNQTEENIAV